MTDEQTRPPLAPGDWDGFSKAEAVRRLLVLSQYQTTPRSPSGVIARLRAFVAGWVAFWRRHW